MFFQSIYKKKLGYLLTHVFLYLIFSHLAVAELTDPEKIKFIKDLAQPLSEKKVFYRWERSPMLSELPDELLQAGELTPELYETFWRRDRFIATGPGVYVAESIHSASILPFSKYILQVEVEKGVKVLDFSNKAIQDKLAKVGIDTDDIRRLPAEVLVSDFREGMDDWWVFKGTRGIKFKPFSIQSVSLADLVMARKFKFTENKEQFKVLNLEQHIQKRVKKAIQTPIQNLEDGVNLFTLGEPYFSPSERSKVLDQIIDHIQTVEDGEKLFQRKYAGLGRSELKKSLNSPPIHAAKMLSLDVEKYIQEAERESFGLSLSEAERSKVFNRILSRVQTIEDGISLLILDDAQDVLSDENNQAIVNKIKKYPIKNLKTAHDLIFRGGEYLSDSDMKKIAIKISPQIQTVGEAVQFSDIFRYLPKPTITKILDQVLPNIEQSGMFSLQVKELLSSVGKYFSKNDITKIVDHTIPILYKSRHLEELLSSVGKYFSEDDITKIVDHALKRFIRTPEDFKNLLSFGGDYFSESHILKIVNDIHQSFSYRDTDDIIRFLNLLEKTRKLEYMQDHKKAINEIIEKRKHAIDNILAQADTADKSAELLKKWGSIFSESERNKIMNTILAQANTADKSAELLKKWGSIFSESERNKIMNTILAQANTADKSAELLKKWDSIFSESERNKIMNTILAQLDTADKGAEFLKKWGSIFSESERNKIINKFVKTTKELKMFRPFLSDSYYKNLKTNIKKSRIDCLKRQLSFIR